MQGSFFVILVSKKERFAFNYKTDAKRNWVLRARLVRVFKQQFLVF